MIINLCLQIVCVIDKILYVREAKTFFFAFVDEDLNEVTLILVPFNIINY